jgi:hypothetical protein
MSSIQSATTSGAPLAPAPEAMTKAFNFANWMPASDAGQPAMWTAIVASVVLHPIAVLLLSISPANGGKWPSASMGFFGALRPMIKVAIGTIPQHHAKGGALSFVPLRMKSV